MSISHGFYESCDFSLWQGRTDAPPQSYVHQLIQFLNLNDIYHRPSGLAFALLGFCSDAGIKRNSGRAGAADAPNEIRKQLARCALHRSNVVLYDAGNILCPNDQLEQAQFELSKAVSLLLEKGITPIVLGGGHEVAYGHYLGLEGHVKDNLGIVNFDSHLDMRPLLPEQKGSSGTPFLQIQEHRHARQLPFHYYCVGLQSHANTNALLNTAEKAGVHVTWADEVINFSKSESTECIDAMLRKHDQLYVTFCLDVMSASIAPGVSAPQIAGLFPHHVLPMMKQLCASKKIISYDLAELSPVHDHNHLTASFAGLVVYTILHHHLQRG